MRRQAASSAGNGGDWRTEVWRETVAPASEVMNISMDGAMVNIRRRLERGETGDRFSCTPSAAMTGKPIAHLSDHSYRAGLWDATEFGQQQWAEACSLGVEKGSVNDGAAWIWNIVRMCYGNCVEIIDWWHAVEKLWQVAQHHFDAESEQADRVGLRPETAVDGRAACAISCATSTPEDIPRAQGDALSLPQSLAYALPPVP